MISGLYILDQSEEKGGIIDVLALEASFPQKQVSEARRWLLRYTRLRKNDDKIPLLCYTAHTGKADEALCSTATTMHAQHEWCSLPAFLHLRWYIFIPAAKEALMLHRVVGKTVLLRIDMIAKLLHTEATVTTGATEVVPDRLNALAVRFTLEMIGDTDLCDMLLIHLTFSYDFFRIIDFISPGIRETLRVGFILLHPVCTYCLVCAGIFAPAHPDWNLYLRC